MANVIVSPAARRDLIGIRDYISDELANPDAPAGLRGLFYTGSFTQLGIQLLGFAAVAAWATLTMRGFFALLKRLRFLRAGKPVMGVRGSRHSRRDLRLPSPASW